MDRDAFDALTRLLAATPSRRRALAALLGSGFASVVRTTVAKPHRNHRTRNTRGRLSAQAADCSSPGHGTNLSGCNFNGADFAGADLSSSRMAGAKFRRANLCGADLSSSNLKNADFREANLTRADLSSSGCGGVQFNAATVFCQTTMCNGSVRNDDCPGVDPDDVCCADADCPEGQVCRDGECGCIPATCQSLGRECGTAPDGCGGALSCGFCGGATPACDEGTCVSCSAMCGAGCFLCMNLIDGNSRCVAAPVTISCLQPCTSSATCTNPATPLCIRSSTTTAGNNTTGVAVTCADSALVAVCAGGANC